ncbi:MAG: DUF2490 domain-containing protein [Nonlabens sp.]
MRYLLAMLVFIVAGNNLWAQEVEESQLGAWYMYFYNKKLGDSTRWGIQGDFQYRDWKGLGDREQLLLRSGVTYRPKDSGVLLTLGYANITSGPYGDSDDFSMENRIYQEALFGNTLFNKFLLTHRFRYEQRWVENQDFRTRYRYNLFVNIPFKGNSLAPGVFYGAFYNELFINGERKIDDNRFVQFFDRNRTYLGLGYVLNNNIRFQAGWMKQTTNFVEKGQLQFSMHHNF